MLGTFVKDWFRYESHFVHGRDSLVDILKERGLLSESDAVQPLIGKKSRSEERRVGKECRSRGWRRLRYTHRLRQRRQPAAVARRGPAEGDVDPRLIGSRPGASPAATPHR